MLGPRVTRYDFRPTAAMTGRHPYIAPDSSSDRGAASAQCLCPRP
jgi:hypothetical protein